VELNLFLVNLLCKRIRTICGQQADGGGMDSENDALVIETLYFAIHKLNKSIRYCKKRRKKEGVLPSPLSTYRTTCPDFGQR